MPKRDRGLSIAAMPAREFIVDPAEIDCGRVLADIEAIRRYLPQRDAMEQLTAIVVDDIENHICVGYRDITASEFWVSGHMPGMPIMPGVIMCECAAQVLTYHIQRNDFSGAEVVGFGGLDGVKFRGVVKPGDRLVMAIQVTKARRGRMVAAKFQGFVGESLVCEGELAGVALPASVANSSAVQS
jgi:3-hydroxyacyl-[acyl-carrier-protein] dehydratase